MKSLLLTLALAANTAWASGTLMLEPRHNLATKKTYVVVGLGTSTKLWGPIGYSSWTGLGDGSKESDYSNWYVTKHQLDFNILGMKLSPGMRFGYSEKMGPFEMKKIETEVYGKLSAPLW